MMKLDYYRLLCLCLATASAEVFAHGPHVHGTAELQVAVENGNLSIEFHSPLDNLIGFEYEPTTDAQRAVVKAMNEKLNKPDTLFKLPKAASCVAGPVKLESEFNKPPAKPAKGAKAAKKEEPEEDHAEMRATFAFVCADMSKLDSMEVVLFGVFPRTRTIKAEIIGPHGQSAATLSPNRRVIKF